MVRNSQWQFLQARINKNVLIFNLQIGHPGQLDCHWTRAQGKGFLSPQCGSWILTSHQDDPASIQKKSNKYQQVISTLHKLWWLAILTNTSWKYPKLAIKFKRAPCLEVSDLSKAFCFTLGTKVTSRLIQALQWCVILWLYLCHNLQIKWASGQWC